jgi:hypothetical protein
MFCDRSGVVSFGPPQAKIILFFWGVKMVQYIHNFYTAAGETNFVFFAVKIVPYIHIFYTVRHRRKQFGIFLEVKITDVFFLLEVWSLFGTIVCLNYFFSKTFFQKTIIIKKTIVPKKYP